MPNVIDANGLQIDSQSDLITNLGNGLKAIYGADINLDSNSPDGQNINNQALSIEDVLQLLEAIYNNFDPDFAQGVVLDQRVAINNIQRQGASYTFQDVQITTDRALNLQGLDADANNPDGTGFTVGDNAGNQFILLDSQTISGAGTYTFSFRARLLGAIETAINTITNPVTVVLGVTAINNSTGATSIGKNGETDYQLRERRKQSVALGSTGYLNGLQGAILNLNGVVDAKVYENYTNTTDGDGIPPHCIYAVVEGGSNDDIANQIYSRKSAGCNMKGNVEVDIIEPSTKIFVAKFDRPSAENLHIQFGIQALVVGQTFDDAAIKEYIVANTPFTIGGAAIAQNISDIAQAAIDSTVGVGKGAVLNLQVSDDGSTWVYYLNTSNIKNKFSLSTANIIIS